RDPRGAGGVRGAPRRAPGRAHAFLPKAGRPVFPGAGRPAVLGRGPPAVSRRRPAGLTLVPTLFGYTLAGLPAARLCGVAGGAVAALTALPFLREHRRRVRVPFAPLWNEAARSPRQERLGRRLRRWLSWLLQLLVLTTVLAALADPRPAGAPAEAQSVVV